MEIKKLRNYTVTCLDCGSELSFENSDIIEQPHEIKHLAAKSDFVNWGFITCPICGKTIHVRYEKEFCDKVKFRYQDLGESEKENKMTTLDDINIDIKKLSSKLDAILDILLETVEISEEKRTAIEAAEVSDFVSDMTRKMKESEGYQKWWEEAKEVFSGKKEANEVNGIKGYDNPEETSPLLDVNAFNEKDFFIHVGDPLHEGTNDIYLLTDLCKKEREIYEIYLRFLIKRIKEKEAKILLVGCEDLKDYEFLSSFFPLNTIYILTDKEELGFRKVKDILNCISVPSLKNFYSSFDSSYDIILRYGEF